MADEILHGALTPPVPALRGADFPPLTMAEQQAFDLLQQALSGDHPSQPMLLRVQHDGHARAVVAVAHQHNDTWDVMPLAMLIDDQLFAQIHAAGDPEPIDFADDLEPTVIADMLSLVQDESPLGIPPLETIAGWAPTTRSEVAAWAMAVHLVASDNDDVQIPPVPGVLRHAGTCQSHDGVHAFRNDPDPCIGWEDASQSGNS